MMNVEDIEGLQDSGIDEWCQIRCDQPDRQCLYTRTTEILFMQWKKS